MPLDSDDEVSGGAFGGLTALYGFDDGILRAAGGDAEAVAGDADGLMVAGVDGEAQEAILLGGLFMGEEGAEERRRDDGGGVGDGYGFACGVVDGHGGEVLDEGSAAPDVEGLQAEADGEDGLVEVMGVLNEELVYIFAGGVGGAALGDGVLAVLLGVDVGGAAGEEDGLAGVDEVGCFGGGGGEGDRDWLAAAALDGGSVLGPGLTVVFEVGAGGDGDGYAGFHAASDDTASAKKGVTAIRMIKADKRGLSLSVPRGTYLSLLSFAVLSF